MTCVLSITHLYQNPCAGGFCEDNSDLKHTHCEKFDFNWIASQHPASPGIGEAPARCSTSCRVEASTVSGSSQGSNSGVTTKVENLTKVFTGQFRHESAIDSTTEDQCVTRQTSEAQVDTLTKSANFEGLHADYNRRLSNFKQPTVSTLYNEPNDCRMQFGIKRKSESCDIDHVPTKRVSPFLNTPKERKDERKKVLKISLKKLRQLEDPEAFLRRTVLVNNTMKRMQSELREEKYRSRKFESNRRKSFNGYNVLNNNCLSNSYLYDDPFLCGVNEKITDDMTETLINNVFHDKPCDVTSGTETTDDNSDKSSDASLVKQSVDQCSMDTNTPKTCDVDHQVVSSLSDRCAHLVSSATCKECNKSDTTCSESSDSLEPMQVHDVTTCSSSMDCSKPLSAFDSCIHATGVTTLNVSPLGVPPLNVNSCGESNVQNQLNKNSCDSDDLNVDISDLDVIADNTYEIQSDVYMDKSMDHKLTSHSFSTCTLVSPFDDHHHSTPSVLT